MPLSNRVGQEITAFRSELRSRIEGMPFRKTPSLIPWIAERLECELSNAAVIFRMHAAQSQVSEIPTADLLLVEELSAADEPVAQQPRRSPGRRTGRRSENADLLTELTPQARVTPTLHYFFHCLIGRAANDALSRVVALRLSRLRGGNAIASPDDYGFVLTVGENQRLSRDELPTLLDPNGFTNELESSLTRSHLLKYHFRNAAQTGLLVYRNYFGERKSARKLQWSSEVIFNVISEHEPDHVLLREARRDAIHSFLDAPGALRFLQHRESAGMPIRHRAVAHVPPLSFGMYATQIKEALLLEEPRETIERLYHHWWNQLGAIVPDPAEGTALGE